MAERSGFLPRMFKLIASFVIFIFLLAIGLTLYWYMGPYRGFTAETFVEVEHGMSSRAIANLLAKQGVVRSPYAFLAARAFHPRATLQAGEYRFGSEQTPLQVFDKIRKGEVFFEELTFPEGSNRFDIAGILKNSDTVKPDDFLKAAADPESIHDLDPLAPNLEGFLFPSTYRVTHQTTAKQLCRTMTAEFRKQWAAAGGNAAGVDLHRSLTLASLVEKESAEPAERPLIAAVFTNRLRQGIPLQCDPTTVYAALLENRYNGVIHRSDLASVNPYNTYAHPGLPPGPIANPGTTAIRAAIKPAEVDYLYFVANPGGQGSHHFSSSLAEHEKAVLAFRQGSH